MKITKINVDDDSLLAQPEKPAKAKPEQKTTAVLIEHGDGSKTFETDFGTIELTGALPNPPASEVIDLYIAKACPNPRWVIGDLGGFRVNVKCPPKLSRSLVRKTVKVRVTRNGDETHYTYEP
jgi:hypothetical protein